MAALIISAYRYVIRPLRTFWSTFLKHALSSILLSHKPTLWEKFWSIALWAYRGALLSSALTVRTGEQWAGTVRLTSASSNEDTENPTQWGPTSYETTSVARILFNTQSNDPPSNIGELNEQNGWLQLEQADHKFILIPDFSNNF
jgi:hypothetical protein